MTAASKSYDHVREYVASEIWAMEERHVRILTSIIEERMAGTIREMSAEAKKNVDPAPNGYRMQGDVAIVPIVGPITKRATLFSKVSGMTSVEQIRTGFRAAMDDKRTSSIILHIDSPGGSVGGIAELATEIFQARESMSILALADGQAASAAYWLASQADAVYMTEGSQVGSIGVYAQVMSDDRRMKNEGIDTLTIRSSELKGIGAGPITPRQEDAMRAQVAKYFEMFKAAVSRGRPMMDVQAAATGLVYLAGDALDMGLVDGVSTLEDLIAIQG